MSKSGLEFQTQCNENLDIVVKHMEIVLCVLWVVERFYKAFLVRIPFYNTVH